jgi:cell division initiation protein
MKLTPLDIHHKEFHHALRGYSEEEVDTFLDEVADEFERLFKENIDMAEKLEAASAKVRDYQSMEVTLNNTLVSAQRSAEQIVAQANEDASTVLRDAEVKAKEIIHAALTDKQKVQGELVRIKQAEEDFRARFRSLLEQHLGGISEVTVPQDVTILMGETAAGPVSEVDVDLGALDIGFAPPAQPAPAAPSEPTGPTAGEADTATAPPATAPPATAPPATAPPASAADFAPPATGQIDALAYMEEPASVPGPLGDVEFVEESSEGEGAGIVESVTLGELESPEFAEEDFGNPREFSMPSFDSFGERDDDTDIEEID